MDWWPAQFFSEIAMQARTISSFAEISLRHSTDFLHLDLNYFPGTRLLRPCYMIAPNHNPKCHENQ